MNATRAFHLLALAGYGAALAAFTAAALAARPAGRVGRDGRDGRRGRRGRRAGGRMLLGAADGIGALALVSNVLALFLRAREAGHVPFPAVYEVCLLIAAVPPAAYGVAAGAWGLWRWAGPRARWGAVLGALSAGASLAASAGALWAGDRVLLLPPALRSPWFVPHVLAYVLGYGLLLLAGLVGLACVVLEGHARWRAPRHPPGGDAGRPRTPSQGGGAASPALLADRLGYALVAAGFVFLTAGLVFGCFWAQAAWGTWWGWDVKETWALITWLVYLLYFHQRLVRGWRGARSGWLALAGAAALLVSFLLFEYLPGGSLHRYT